MQLFTVGCVPGGLPPALSHGGAPLNLLALKFCPPPINFGAPQVCVSFLPDTSLWVFLRRLGAGTPMPHSCEEILMFYYRDISRSQGPTERLCIVIHLLDIVIQLLDNSKGLKVIDKPQQTYFLRKFFRKTRQPLIVCCLVPWQKRTSTYETSVYTKMEVNLKSF